MAAQMQNPGLALRASHDLLFDGCLRFPFHCIGLTGANSCLPFLPVAVDVICAPEADAAVSALPDDFLSWRDNVARWSR
jgi:hypothetical protein